MTTNEKALLMHEEWNGKIETVSKSPVKSREDLSIAYTPGVAEPCNVIAKDKEAAYKYTMKANTIAVVSDGSAVLGLGNIGPYAAMPVMEGKAVLFKEFGGVNAVPICLDTQDTEEIIKAVTYLAPGFGGINLEDIKAPECFEIERRLKEELDIPVMHDDQHGTAVVTLAALINATARVDVDLRDSVVGQIGLGAAGIGIARLLRSYGVKRVLGADIHPHAIERLERFGGEGRSLDALMAEADIVIATTGVPGLIKPEKVRPGQIILALSNPEPEIAPRRALQQGAIFAADGGSVNNALGFPGLFRGALEARATQFTDEMLFAAANALAELTPTDALVHYVLDLEVHSKVAEAVKEAALGLGSRGTLRLSI